MSSVHLKGRNSAHINAEGLPYSTYVNRFTLLFQTKENHYKHAGRYRSVGLYSKYRSLVNDKQDTTKKSS
jgi:hypothetical protein